MKYQVAPCFFDEACIFVQRHHRHHKPPRSHVFSLAAADEQERVRGVVIVGRPVARALQDGVTLEVLRLTTDGARNACSFLYAAARRAAHALGYRRLITYILQTETGTSLKAAGWVLSGKTKGGSWNTPARPRVDKHPTQGKLRWEAQP